MNCILGQLSTHYSVHCICLYRSNHISRINIFKSDRHIVIIFTISYNCLFHKLADIIKNLVIRTIVSYILGDSLIRIYQTFFSSFSNHDNTMTLFFDSVNDLLIESIGSIELIGAFGNQTYVYILVS